MHHRNYHHLKAVSVLHPFYLRTWRISTYIATNQLLTNDRTQSIRSMYYQFVGWCSLPRCKKMEYFYTISTIVKIEPETDLTESRFEEIQKGLLTRHADAETYLIFVFFASALAGEVFKKYYKKWVWEPECFSKKRGLILYVAFWKVITEYLSKYWNAYYSFQDLIIFTFSLAIRKPMHVYTYKQDSTSYPDESSPSMNRVKTRKWLIY